MVMRSSLEKIDDRLKLLVPVMGTIKVQRLRQMYLFEDDPKERRDIENHIELLISKHVKMGVDDTVILPPPDQHICAGDINIGVARYACRDMGRVGLNLKDINRHLGVFGATGSGKTTFAINILSNLHKKGIKFLLFDWEKSYRGLAKIFHDVIVLSAGSRINPFFINPLQVPPGISTDEYIKSLVSLFGEDYLSGPGSDTILLDYLKKTYAEHKNPTFEDFKNITVREIRGEEKKKGSLRGRKGMWKQTAERILYFLSIGASSEILGNKNPFPFEKLLDGNVVIELGYVQSPRDRKFVIHCILNWLLLWVQHHDIEIENLKNLFAFEEFHNVTLRGKEDNLISVLFRQVRKYGIGLMALDQTPSEIPNAVYANMNTKVAFNMNTIPDKKTIAGSLNMPAYHDGYFNMLKPGDAIIQISQRHPLPFLIKADHVDFDIKCDESDLAAMMDRFSSIYMPDIDSLLDPSSFQSSQEVDNSPPDPLEKVILQSIADRPLDGVDARTKRLGLHPTQMVKIQTALMEKSIFKEVSVDRKKLFELTSEGRIHAIELGISVKKHPSRGGVEHLYWIDKIATHLKSIGGTPILELKDIDITDTTAGTVIEVETGKSDIKKNLLKLEKSRFLRRFMSPTTRAAEKKSQGIAAPHSSIRVVYVRDFLKLSPQGVTTPNTRNRENSAE